MPGATFSQDTRSIAVQTPLGKDVLLLRSLKGDEGISRLFHFELELLTTQSAIDFSKVVGHAATVGVRLADGTDRFFNGFVSSLAVLGGEGSFTVYRAELVPWMWLLTRTTDCRVFQNQSIPSIIEKVFGDLGFHDFQSRLKNVYPPREYCVQYRETDFNFVSRLMEQCGIFYYFQHENGKHTLVMTDTSSEHTAFPGLERARYRAMKDASQYEPDVITSWAVSMELRPSKYSLGAYNFETPSVNLTVQVESPPVGEGAAPAAKYEVYDYPGGYLKRPEGEGIVRVRIEEQESQVVTVRGTSTCRGLASGYRFELVDHPQQDANQQYVVTAVTHSAAETSYGAAKKETSGQYKNSFAAVPLRVPFRPRRVTPRPVIHGVQTAVVVGKKGEELWVDKHGRVKIQFFWDREGKRDENSSCWVRVAQNWAGKRWGAMFLPRIGQEVIVAFLEGDPDAPIITGRVYNGEQMPPYDLPAEQSKSALKSSTTKGGKGFNEIRFDDKAGAEQLFVHGQRDLDWVIERQSRELVGEERHVIIRGSRVEQVDKEQHLKVTGDLVEEVGGARFAAADKGLFLRAGSRIVIETGGEITLKAAGGFITIGAGGVAIQGTLVNINSGGAAGGAPAKAVRVPNQASSAAAGEAAEPGAAGTIEEPPVAADPVLLYREALEKNRDKMSEEDRKAYEQALKELEDARNRKDEAGMRAAKAKLDAILQKNGIPVPAGADAAIAAAAGVTPETPPPADAVPATPLHQEGQHLKKQDGTIWKYKGLTAFSALDDWLKGNKAKLESYASWARPLGVNIWRVFSIWNNLKLKPQDDRYYTELEAFLVWLRGQGFHSHLVALCDQVGGSGVRLPKDQQIAHLQRVIEISRRTGNVLIEEFNEFEKNDDDGVCGMLSPSAYQGVPATRSWWGENQHWRHAGALLSWTTGHTDRGREWTRQFIQSLDVAQRGYGLPDGTPVPATRLPHVLGEPRRVAEGSTPRQHADYHAGGLLMGAGGCLHGGFKTIDGRHESDLQFCVVPSGVSLACAEAVGQVFRSKLWPPNTPDGNYVRGGVNDFNDDNKGDCPIIHRDRYFGGSPQVASGEFDDGAARSFFMELGGTYYGLAVDPGPKWKLQVRNGFKLVAQGGYDDGVHGPNLLVLQRA